MKPPAPLRAAPPVLPFLVGLGTVAAARLLTLPASPWEWDEVLFMRGVQHFQPLQHHPHPPGYPLLIGLGKLFALVLGDPFRALVALSVVASLIGYVALVDAFRHLAASPGAAPIERAAADRAAILGAALFQLSPAMLVYGPLALSDAPALAFLALALAAAARLHESRSAGAAIALGAFASAAVGVRPQLAVAVLPMLLIALLLAHRRRRLLEGLAAFTLVSLLWFVPLVAALGGPRALVPYLTRQGGNVLLYDTVQPRAGASSFAIATRFITHPWGTRLTALPVLLLALVGAVTVIARRPRQDAEPPASLRMTSAAPWLPLLILAGTDLSLCLFFLNPDDAVRYALPSMLAVAALSGMGCVAVTRALRAPQLAWVAGAALAVGFVSFTWPLLAARSATPSPPVQAARWFAHSQPSSAILLVEPSLADHADLLLPHVARFPVAEGVPSAALAAQAPVWLLGDGESGLPGARTFRWPASDAYGKLTRRHYGVVSLSPLPGTQRFQVLSGVHGPEPSLRAPGWRWLDATAAIRLGDGGPGGHALALTLRLPENVPWPSNTVTVGVAGRDASTIALRRGETQRVVLPIGAAEQVDVTFRSRAAFVPARSGLGPDYRRLAVQLVGVEQVAPTEARPANLHASRRPS
jgi:4-amino-4-deoxy-L-arabinose transferase-like glycosyltransferase